MPDYQMLPDGVLDFLVSEVKELREVMTPMVLMFQEGEKLNQWTNNIINAIDLLE